MGTGRKGIWGTKATGRQYHCEEGFPRGSVVKNLPAVQETQVQSPVRKIPWSRKWQPTPVFVLGNPMNRGAWWAKVHRVAKSRTQLSNSARVQHFKDSKE